MNGQIVLCKGVNDGDQLEYSISRLKEYLPYLRSVSVVPVGLTKYREGLAELEPFGKEDAKKVLQTVHKWQDEIYRECGTHFIHAGDEWYLLAEEEIPGEERYDLSLIHIYVTDICTCCNPELLYSHRASGGKRGNLAAFLGIRRSM